jgi:hypothetical protein
MPKQTAYLNKEKTDFVILRWGFNWRKLSLNYNGNVIGLVPKKKELKKGQTFSLDSQRTISVKLTGLLFSNLEILVNGSYVKGSGNDPQVQLMQAYLTTLVFGLINLSIGTTVLLFQVKFFLNAGVGIETVLAGILVTLLALGIRRGSILALYGFWVLLMVDLLFSIYFAVEDHSNMIVSAALKIFLMIFIYRGVKAVKLIRAGKAAGA